jgi:hypothetical protein
MPDKATLEEQAMMNEERRRLWMAIARLEQWFIGDNRRGFTVMQITIQSPAHTGRDWRAIVKGSPDMGPLHVAFANADSLASILVTVAKGMEDGFLKWREDRPYDPSAAGKGRPSPEG